MVSTGSTASLNQENNALEGLLLRGAGRDGEATGLTEHSIKRK